jgi:hypothetical protein
MTVLRKIHLIRSAKAARAYAPHEKFLKYAGIDAFISSIGIWVSRKIMI